MPQGAHRGARRQVIDKPDLEGRLAAHFATLRSSPLKSALTNWHVYAAVTGSAMAMVTGASAAAIHASSIDPSDPVAAVAPAQLNAASARTVQLLNSMKVAATAAQTAPGDPTQSQAPGILNGGVVPLYSKSGTIQSGEWVSIYGLNLAATTAMWNNDFPQSLAGTSVTINNKPAYLLYVSPNQINLQAPEDDATGTVAVVVTTAAGSATTSVTLGTVAPSFSLIDSKHVSGIILRNDGKGLFGNGTYDILGPAGNSLGFETVPAKAGDIVVFFGFGFGPTNPSVPAGQIFSQVAPVPITDPLQLTIDNVPVKTMFTGISSAGLYQINVKIPAGLGNGDVPLQAMVGGVLTQPGVFIPLEEAITGGGTVGGTFGGGPVGTSPAPPFLSSYPVMSSFPGGSFGGGTAGGGGSSDARRKKKFEPKKLYFPPKP